MRGFIVMCLVACAFAAPQYSYNQGSSQYTSSVGSYGLGSGNGGLSFGGLGVNGLNGLSGFTSYGGGHGSGGIGLSGFSSGHGSSIGLGGLGGGLGGGLAFGGGGAHHQGPIVTKQFFIHSAPEENDEDGIQKVVSLGPSRKHYRVVFIKAPHNSVKSSSVRFTQPQNEEKTVIYVLSKKTDAADIQTNVDAAHTEPSKPEVFFIKYKTQDEANHAQRTIQAQYDSLGGSSQVSDEGVAPISSVIGALGNRDHIGEYSSGVGSLAAPVVTTSFNTISPVVTNAAGYLPPTTKK